jgi:hypothetical protein
MEGDDNAAEVGMLQIPNTTFQDRPEDIKVSLEPAFTWCYRAAAFTWCCIQSLPHDSDQRR